MIAGCIQGIFLKGGKGEGFFQGGHSNAARFEKGFCVLKRHKEKRGKVGSAFFGTEAIGEEKADEHPLDDWGVDGFPRDAKGAFVFFFFHQGREGIENLLPALGNVPGVGPDGLQKIPTVD